MKNLTYANVVSSICLFLLLAGGAAYGAAQLGKDSVGSKQLKNGAVTTTKIKNGAVTGAKVKVATLGKVPLAKQADSAAPSGAAGGDLGGSYPAPTVKDGAITAAKLNVPATFVSAGLADGSPGCGALKNFVNWTPTVNERVGYYRTPDGFVHLQGTAQQCSPFDGIIFHLPPGFRPAAKTYFQASIANGSGGTDEISISADGEVLAFVPNTEAVVALDGISFRCTPSGGAGCP